MNEHNVVKTVDRHKLIDRTCRSDCPACQNGRVHNNEEWKQYHPLAGTGVNEPFGEKKEEKGK